MLESLLNQPGWLVLLVVGLVVFLEDAAFVGFVIPGESVAILGGVSASLGHVSLASMLAVVAAAAVVGDSVGYEVGRHFGPRILGLQALQKHAARIESARATLTERGGIAVFIGRWTAFLRAVTPALAGMARMPYRIFLPWNAGGGLAWTAVVVVGGYLAGHSYQRVETWLGRGGAVLALVVVLVVVVVVHRRRTADEQTSDAVADVREGPAHE